ncbi:MAG: hemerythrin domain-containing protein [Phycisphaerae bacterium]
MGSCGCHHHDAGEPTVRRVLMDEHRVIERVLDAVERMVEADAVDAPFLTQAIDFFRNFADGCHHFKEERALFPALERQGVPRDGGPIGCMLHEHDQGRAYIRAMNESLSAAAAGDAAARRAVHAAARGYIDMLRQHIQKEDHVLFVMAEQVLPASEQAAMLRTFEQVETAPDAVGKHERYVALADRLENWSFAPRACRV